MTTLCLSALALCLHTERMMVKVDPRMAPISRAQGMLLLLRNATAILACQIPSKAKAALMPAARNNERAGPPQDLHCSLKQTCHVTTRLLGLATLMRGRCNLPLFPSNNQPCHNACCQFFKPASSPLGSLGCQPGTSKQVMPLYLPNAKGPCATLVEPIT